MKQTTAIQLLNYWLECIRTEEALSVRPKSWRSEASLLGNHINMRSPTPGRTYFKLSLAETAQLIESDATPLIRPMDQETSELFETWLASQYRMPYQTDDAQLFMVSCPIMPLRYGELAGLIRFAVALTFSYGDSDFVVPTPKKRRTGEYPPPPTEIHLKRLPKENGFPLYLDGKLLRRELGATAEEVDDLYRNLSSDIATNPGGTPFLAELVSLLDGHPRPDAPIAVDLLHRLTQEMTRRLCGTRFEEQCYPVGIVMDAGRVKTTWHLQRDIKSLLRKPEALKERANLWRYMAKKGAGLNEKPLVGLFKKPGLTKSQHKAARQFLGTPYLAVQGPPGCGKTTLIHHVAAHFMVKRIAAYVETDEMPTDIAVVTSTNNRAVDNAVDGLDIDDFIALPLALRAGSRRVCLETLVPRLRKVQRWLSFEANRVSEDEKTRQLADAKKAFSATKGALDDVLAPAIARTKAIAKQRKLKKELSEITAKLGNAEADHNGDIKAVMAALHLCRRLDKRLDALSAKCDGQPTKKRLKQVQDLFEFKIKGLLEKSANALAEVGLEAVVFNPRKSKGHIKAEIEQWEDDVEEALNTVYEHLAYLESRYLLEKQFNRKLTIEQSLDALVIPQDVSVDETRGDELRLELFGCAMAVRRAWAVCQAEKLVQAVQTAGRAAEDQASLRRFCQTKGASFELLRALFPVWGTTLLSLGNIFPDGGDGTIDRIIIDEAGQCHPAYAVSALMRSRRALVLGDVHQLSPIFELTEQDEQPIFDKSIGEKGAIDADYRVFDRAHTSVQLLVEQGMEGACRLTEHFRCQKEIISISDRLCDYTLNVLTPPASFSNRPPVLDRAVRFFHVDGKQERLGGSWWNREEGRVVMRLIDSVLRAGLAPEDVAVITPYRGQLYKLRRALAARGIPIEQSPELFDEPDSTRALQSRGMALGTVHRFQGGERSIVIFTTVVTQKRSLVFLNERANLINVAVSRAQNHLLVVGHGPTLAQGRLTQCLIPDM